MLKMCENLQNYCRICLDIESEHVCIQDNPLITVQMKSCLALTFLPKDDLPKLICVTCVSQLNSFYNFLMNARCSQDWLESMIQEKNRKINESKLTLQPLPDSEYNSDSLLEFLNNTANIEEYLNNLGKEDIPSIVNLLDKQPENGVEIEKQTNILKCKQLSPKKLGNSEKNMFLEIDVLDSDMEIVKEILNKKVVSKKAVDVKCDRIIQCFACQTKFQSVQKLDLHLSVCVLANSTCKICLTHFDSKTKMLQHRIDSHITLPWTCECGKKFFAHKTLLCHYKICYVDYLINSCSYRCKKCGETFKERYKLYKHVKQHILKVEEKVCDICGHNFIGDKALNTHRINEHQNPDNMQYRCKVCQFVSHNRAEMYVHVQKHTGTLESNSHLCEWCGCRFTTRATLLRHAVQHCNVTYKCSICSKKFIDCEAKNNHEKKHSEMTICEKCGHPVVNYHISTHICK